MYEAKTRPEPTPVSDFLAKVEDPRRRQDCEVVMGLMEAIVGEPPVMWGPSIIGFGRYHYRYETGHEGDAPLTGVSPRKAALTLYLAPYPGSIDDLLARLGKHKMGKGCLYITRLSGVDTAVLKEIITRSVAEMRARYP